MSILSAIKQQHSSIDDLAKLPQAAIMQMVQHKQIDETMLAPILARKAELADAFARETALQNAGKAQPTVMEQLLTKNAEAEHPQQMAQLPEEAGVGQLPIPERAYAGGGIIAFDDGGEVGDEDPYEERRRESRMASFGTPVEDLYKLLKSGLSKAKDYIPESYDQAKARASAPQEQRKGGHKYEEAVIAEAKRQGVDPNLALHVLYKETGNLANPESARSKAGAIGVMQLMPKTAKELGVNPMDPMENIQGGISYLKKMYGKYQDPALAAAAYNAGPGRLDKALKSEAGLSSLSPETRKYIVGLAEGGEVKHFAAGDYLPFGEEVPYDESQSWGLRDWWNRITPGTKEYILESEKNKKRAAEAKKPSASATPAVTTSPDVQATINDMAREQKTDPQRDIFNAINERNAAQREDIKKSAAEDRNLALLAAGLGMMGGTSPYAFANIGQGALKGVEFLGGSKAKRAAELNALNKSEIESLYYGAENTRKNMVQGALERERAIDNLSTYDAKIRKNFFMEGVAPTPKQLEAYENAKRNDPIYQRLIRDAGMYGNTAPASPVYNYNPKTRSLG